MIINRKNRNRISDLIFILLKLEILEGRDAREVGNSFKMRYFFEMDLDDDFT